jgi:hypothetical protein
MADNLLIGIGMDALTINPDAYVSKSGMKSASDFAASKSNPFMGFGLCGHSSSYDPTLSADDPHTEVSNLFNSSSDNDLTIDLCHTRRILLKSIVTYNDLSNVAETSSKVSSSALGRNLFVQSHHLSVIANIFKDNMIGAGNQTLSDMNCGFGITTSASQPDGYFKDNNGIIRGIIEVKGNTDTPVEALRQAATEASNVALSQLCAGVHVNNILVPIIGSNGYLMQFGVVIMYATSFPVVLMVSKVLDLTDEASLCEAARYLFCCLKICKTPLQVQSQSRLADPPPVIQLSLHLYYLKPLTNFFMTTGNMQTSLFYYFKVMSCLMKSEACRPHVLFPICVREYADDPSKSSIVFPRLRPEEYHIGLPSNKNMRVKFLNKLELAMHCFHAVGVVHLDLYLSNIIWRELNEDVEIKIIDWDSAQLIETGLSDIVLKRLTSDRNALYKISFTEGQAFDYTYEHYDISLLKVLLFFQDEPDLQAKTKAELDLAFRHAQKKYLDKVLTI